jgi:hypothetical protein
LELAQPPFPPHMPFKMPALTHSIAQQSSGQGWWLDKNDRTINKEWQLQENVKKQT